jgi:NTP pyrophosphatase (non-canonical NTP hydrolase)
MNEKVLLIRELSSRPEMLLQLVEEANELAIAAIELKKKMVFRNSDYGKYKDNFIEEIADVKLSIDIVGDYLNNVKSTKLKGSKFEITERLSKYCCKLAKAVIKLRRATTKGASPTPITKEEAEENLIKCIAAIKSCIDSIGDYWDCDEVNTIYEEKADRCINRYTNT